MERWAKFFELIPFLLSSGQDHRINKVRVMETLITAAIVAGVTYGAIKTDVQNIKEALVEFKTEIRTDMRNMSQRIDRVTERTRR